MNWTLSIGRFWRGHLTHWEAIKGTGQHFDADSDEELEAEVRRELVEIARANGVIDPETLKDILLASMAPSRAPRSDPAD
jgi:hypothetical protein